MKMKEEKELSIEKQSYTTAQREAMHNIMKLSSKLIEAIPQNNDDFLWELLELCINSIPEADYGSISIIDETTWRFAAAKGHDWEKLRKIKLKPEHSIRFSLLDRSISSNVYIIEDILRTDVANIPVDILEQLTKASKPIKQSLIAEICFNGICKGHICLDIAEHNSKCFGENSKEIIKAIGDLTSAFIMMKETYCMVNGLEQIVNNRTQAVRNLLNNIGQGLLTFGKDLIVHKDYSNECQRILGEGIENKVFSQLIYPENREEARFVEQILREVFDCKEAYRIQVYLSLMPNEIELASKYISLEYKLVDNIYEPLEKAIMVIMTEVTEKKLLENKVKEDEDLMSMVANVAGNFSGFLECVKEFQYFYGSKLHEILSSKETVSAIYANVYREIHTFKGSFSQFGMKSSVALLHSMESALSYIGTMLESFTHRDLCAFIYSFDIIDFLNEDMEILQEKLGSHFFSMGEMIYIDKTKLLQIESEVVNICSPVECRTILPLIKRLKYKSLKEMLSNYTNYAVKLAERLEKPVNVFSIEGDDLLVDSDKYNGFVKSLVHVFRNSVDHGLESLDKRIEQGKPEISSINCSINVYENYLKICIQDDGGGINFEQIRNKAVACGLYDFETASKLEEYQLIELIFKENFSTKNEITELSGRGMGLYAVKSEVERLGGSVELHTSINKGTKLEFFIPNADVEYEEPLRAASFVQPVLTTTLDFLKEHLDSNLVINRITPFNATNFQMHHYTSFINIRGIFDGLFAISMDNRMSHALMECMVYDEIQDNLINKYTKDVIAECANMILGNSIKAYPNIEELIIIATPSVIYSASGDISYEGNDINGYKVETDKGTITISIIQ
jgi:two-component system chemotaxis sensor kinase CheA